MLKVHAESPHGAATEQDATVPSHPGHAQEQPEKGANMATEHNEFFVLKVEGGGPPSVVRVDRTGAVARAQDLARQTKSPVLLIKAIERDSPVLPADEPIEVKVEVLP
jgi:hypothetical protein